MKSSRRKFMQLALGAPLAAGMGGHGLTAFGSPALLVPGMGRETFSNPQIIRYDGQCFTVNGQDIFIRSGSFHYARCAKELWSDRLTKFKQAGFNTIMTYVFWNYHEPVEGQAQMGELEDFIKLVQKAGLYLIVRPGPYACAEWDAGGFPHWIIARQFPLRSAHTESIKTSQHWFNLVLPVIRRHTITSGGPVILIQIENEYDYWRLPSPEKTKYMTALAQMVWNAGIDIPIIANWCEQTLDKSNSVMARITDTADFYPRWNITGTLPRLMEIRKKQPEAPLGVTELQGGWFSRNGGKLSVDQPGVDAAQLDALTKTMIEHGVTYYNYYMGFGGTNFDWAAKTLTTTYDYAAPIREPGGLWEKYYAARGICSFLNRCGPMLARASAIEGPQSTNAAVSVSERVNGKSGVLFVRENADATQQYKLTLIDPASPTHRLITVPRQGQLTIGAREMKMLPLQVPLPGSQLRYSTAEMLDYGVFVDRGFLMLYDEPGRVAEIALATRREPHIEGETQYQYWDSEYETVVIGVEVGTQEKILLLNGELMVVVLPRELALRTWMAEYPVATVPDAGKTGKMQTPFITDCAMMGETGSKGRSAWAELDFTPGDHSLTTFWSSQPAKCLVDGRRTEVTYHPHRRTARMVIQTPSVPAQPVNLTAVESWIEKFDLGSGDWITGQAGPLEMLGQIPYGYVKYRAQFEAVSGATMQISTFAGDGKQVFINGRHVKKASTPQAQVECGISSYLASGPNTLEVSYELFGSPNFGPRMAELKGLQSAQVKTSAGQSAVIHPWKIQRVPAAMHGRAIDPNFTVGGWQSASLSGAAPDSGMIPAYCWTRATFSLDQPEEGWFVPWKAVMDADRDALLYLNGRFVGRYVTEGPQKEFYLPEPWIQWGKGSQNILTVVLAYADNPQHLKALNISPYTEFATRRARVEFQWA